MTTKEVMDEIKRMTPEERAEIAKFLRTFDGDSEIRYADDEVIEKIAETIFDRHADIMRKLAS